MSVGYKYKIEYGKGFSKTSIVENDTIRGAIATFLIWYHHDMISLGNGAGSDPVALRITVKKENITSVYYVELKSSVREYPRIDKYLYAKVLKNGKLGKFRLIFR